MHRKTGKGDDANYTHENEDKSNSDQNYASRRLPLEGKNACTDYINPSLIVCVWDKTLPPKPQTPFLRRSLTARLPQAATEEFSDSVIYWSDRIIFGESTLCSEVFSLSR
jgi:hypothetical protein